MKAVVVERPGEVVIRETKAPKIGPYDALVRMDAGCICNSTDTKLIDGHFPGVGDYPLILGHEGVGTVAETGAKVRSFDAGDRVIGALNLAPAEEGLAGAWGAFAEYALVGDHQAMCADDVADDRHGWQEVYEIMMKVPDDIGDDDAVLLCTWREVLGSFSDFGLVEGKSVLIFGGGPVGQSFVKLARLCGLGPIVMTDKIEWKMEHARRMGANVTVPADAADFAGIARQSAPDGFDFVVDAVGSTAIINLAMKLVRSAASICVYGTIPEEDITIHKSDGPYNWNMLLHQWPTRAYESAAHLPLCEMIRDGRLSANDFITHRYSIHEINKAVEKVKQGETLKVFLECDWS